jgi:paraquat-inducible protein A
MNEHADEARLSRSSTTAAANVPDGIRGVTVPSSGGLRAGPLVLSLAAAALLVAALLLPFLSCTIDVPTPDWMLKAERALPFLGLEGRLQSWVVEFSGVPIGERTLPDIVSDLWTAGDRFLACTIFAFSLLFPALKIVLSAVLASSLSLGQDLRSVLVKVLVFTKNWSMADVFLVALIVVFFKAEGVHLQFVVESGLYCFAAAAALSSVAVFLIGRSEYLTRAAELRSIADQLRGLDSAESADLADRVDTLRLAATPLLAPQSKDRTP